LFESKKYNHIYRITANHKDLWNCGGSFFGMHYKLTIQSCV